MISMEISVGKNMTNGTILWLHSVSRDLPKSGVEG